MIGALKKIFSKTEGNEETDSEFSDLEPTSNPNFLTDPDKINKLLKDIEDTSPLCTITIKGTDEEFSSSILDVQLESKQIILDELLPKHGNELLVKQNKLKLFTIFNGIHLSFRLSDIKAGASQGISYYKSAIPFRIYYPQRRASPRIQLHALNIPFSGISRRKKTTVGGYIFDISREGIAIVTQNNRARIQRGDIITDCRINIDGYSIIFDLNVRFVKTTNYNTGKTQIGGFFDNIPSKKLNKLEHYIVTLEREEIRKRKSDTERF